MADKQHPNDKQSSRVDQILDLLVDEIEERMEARRQPLLSEPPADKAPSEWRHPFVETPAPPVTPPAASVEALTEPADKAPSEWRHIGMAASEWRHPSAEVEEQPPEPEPELLPSLPGLSHAARLMGRLALGLFVAIVLINIPFNRYGTTLATAMPDSAALVIRDGLVVKEENDEDIYVYQDGRFRWISSLDAFEHYGFTWGDVHIVQGGYLDRYKIDDDSPLHVLLKCPESPHIYRLEGGLKRWIRDIDTFTGEGHVWEDVHFVSCEYLRSLPDGETIPPGSGPPPQP